MTIHPMMHSSAAQSTTAMTKNSRAAAPHGLSSAHEPYLERKQQYGYRRGTGTVDPVGDVELVEEDGVVCVDDAEERIHRKAVGDLHPMPHDAKRKKYMMMPRQKAHVLGSK